MKTKPSIENHTGKVSYLESYKYFGAFSMSVSSVFLEIWGYRPTYIHTHVHTILLYNIDILKSCSFNYEIMKKDI